MDISLPDLHSLIYGFEEFFAAGPISVHPSDRPIFKVHVVPFHIGVSIRNADPDESKFHVEFYPPDRSEVWNAHAWSESLTKRLRLAGQVSTYFQTSAEAQRSTLERALITHFKSLNLPFRHARALSEMLIAGPENPHIYDLVTIPPEIVAQLNSYRNEKFSLSDSSSGEA